MAVAFIFPGQGSQFVGMGRDLAENFASARAVFQEVDDALSQDLSFIMWNGPKEDLTLTANAQPALMAASVAAARVMEREFGIGVNSAFCVAGHSLGEYSALCAAGSLSLADTARLLRVRGKAMQLAVPVGEGAVAALLGISMEDAEAAVNEGSASGVCQIANDNASGQVVISGSKHAVEVAAGAARRMGVRKAVMLPVSAPPHCDMMQPAADAMGDALAKVDLNAPLVPLVNNVTAGPVTDPDRIRTDLIAQVTGRVRWRESVEWMAAEGVTDFFELGCGKVLTVMLRRIVKGVSGHAVNDADSMESLASVSGER
ncbi:MAG: ACP S-malonyltransferase [Hyphomonadaceae bacterium]|nr:ACP S-malonyltransferase [Hyphomonadaceae bacterium]MBC6412118.1 ACP S-malonyltransferase [Hyphomonadaceae bacterium]